MNFGSHIGQISRRYNEEISEHIKTTIKQLTPTQPLAVRNDASAEVCVSHLNSCSAWENFSCSYCNYLSL